MHCGYPEGAGAVLIVELDGPAAEVAAQFDQVERLCRDNGAFEIRIAADDAERALFWKGRKSAFAAVGRISPDYIVQDGVIPRTALPEVLRRIGELSAERGIRVANVFHAGDGNLHPLVLFDAAVDGADRARPRRSPARSSTCASSTAARSPASTASAWTRRSTCPGCSPTTTWTPCSWCGAPSTRPVAGQPRQGLPDPPAVRRGAGPAQGCPSRRRRPASRRCSDHGRRDPRRAPGRHRRDGGRRHRADPARDAVRPAGDGDRRRRTGPVARRARLHRGRRPRCSGRRPRTASRWCSAARGTKQDWGNPPRRLDLILDTRRLTGVVEHAAGDLITVVRAGTRLDELAERAGRRPASSSRWTRRCPAPPSAARSPPAPAGRAGCSTAPSATC